MPLSSEFGAIEPWTPGAPCWSGSPLPRGAIWAQPPQHRCCQTLRMSLLAASEGMCCGLGTACTPGGTRTTCCGRCEAQFSTGLCVEDRLLVLSNSVEVLWLEPLCFSYQFLLLLKKSMLLLLLGRALTGPCFFYSAAPQTLLTCGKLLISTTSTICQAEPDQSIKIITRRADAQIVPFCTSHFLL